jgi:hypothetical protein
MDIRVGKQTEKIEWLNCLLALLLRLLFDSEDSSTTSVNFYQTIQRHVSQDIILHIHLEPHKSSCMSYN